MLSSTRSIYRHLFSRVAAVGILLAVIEGGAAHFYARGDVAQGIVEHARLGTEALRALVDAKRDAQGGPWTTVIQEALEDLDERPKLGAWGSFVAVEVNDATGHRVGRLVRAPAKAVTEALPDVPAADDATILHPIRLGKVVRTGNRNLVPVLVTIAGSDGSTGAYVRAVYEVSRQAIAGLHRRSVLNVLMVVVAVLSTVLVIYPIVRALTERLVSLSSSLLDANLASLRVLGSAIAKRDSDTDAHNYRVTLYAVRLAEQAGLDDAEIRAMIKGAFLHDVGKIGTPDRILLKPGKLDEAEFAEMKRHVIHGREIVAGSSWLQDAGAVVAYHHERFDGAGYQEGLVGNEIPIAARIFAIADVFDALTSERPYKKPFSLERSMQILREGLGHHFDPALVTAFEEIAEPLYRQFANGEENSQRELESLIDRYFRRSLGAILDGRRQ